MNSFLEFLVSFFLNTYAFDSSSLFRVKTNLSEKESRRPGDQACQRLSKPSEHPGSRLLKTPSQADGGSVREGKTDSVLVISMMSLEEEARRLCRSSGFSQCIWTRCTPWLSCGLREGMRFSFSEKGNPKGRSLNIFHK